MTPSPFLIQLALLFLPGVIWTHLDVRFGRKPNLSQIEFLFRSLLFGLASYLIVYLVYQMLGFEFVLVDLDKVEKQSVLNRAIAVQIAVATLAGGVLGIVWLYVVNYKLITRVLQKIGATRTYGDEDVWDYAFNSKSAESEYVHVRDFENKIVYAGWVRAFSESGKLRELLMYNVQVFDFDGALLFDIPRVYIARGTEGMHVEFPATSREVENGK